MSLPLGTEQSIAEPGQRPQGKRRSRKGRTALLAVAAFVLVSALIAGGYLFGLVQTFDSNTKKIEAAFPEESNRPEKRVQGPGTPATNILVMGSDSRGATDVDAANGTATNQRADTIMVVHIPADRENIYSISLMRDLWVDIPGHGEAKINAALALGGVPLMVQTVESIFGQRLDHVAMVDFEGFKDLTDALGGVDVNVTVPFTSGGGRPHVFTPGVNTLNGEQALAFVRERYAFVDGDYQRVRNQQAFVKGILGKIISAKTFANPLTVSGMVGAISPFISLDKGLTAEKVAALGLELKDIRQHNVQMFTVPTLGTSTSRDGQSIVLPDHTAIDNLAKALGQEALGDYMTANNLTNGN